MPPVRFNLPTYRRTPAVHRSRFITMAIATLSLLLSPPLSAPPRVIVVATIISIALRMNPSIFCHARTDAQCPEVPCQEFFEEPRCCHLSSPPSPPPPTTTTSAASMPRGTFHWAVAYATIFSSTIQPTNQPTNPPILLFVQLIFQSRSYKFLTHNFPVIKKKVIKQPCVLLGAHNFPQNTPFF